MNLQTISFDEGVAVMIDAGFSSDQFLAKWGEWIDRDDVVLIFQNEDLGHPEIGALVTMPWDAGDELPPHAPDSPAIGLGWRYLTKYVIRSR